MKRQCTSSTIAAACVLLLSGTHGFVPTPIRHISSSSTHQRPTSILCPLNAALSPRDDREIKRSDKPSPLAASLVDTADSTITAEKAYNNKNTPQGDDLLESLANSMDDDLIQNVLDNSSNLRTNKLYQLGILTAVTVISLSALLTIDLAGGITRGWTVAETAARIPLDDWAFYNDVLQKYPVLTKAATSGTVYGIGDVIAQSVTEGKEVGELDMGRVTRSLLAGFIAHGPLSHVWYIVSDQFFDSIHMTAWWSVFPKIFVDQTMWGPLWTTIYLLMTGLMQREEVGSIGDNIKRSIIPLTVSGLKLWPLAHCITYGVIPVENRLLWVDFVEIFWVVLLSTQAADLAEKSDELAGGEELTVVSEEKGLATEAR